MAKTTRNLAMAVAAATIAVPHTSMVADAPVSTVPPMSHVRTTDPEVAAVVRNTFDRSATFRKLVAIIDASDSYVYVQAGQCSHSVRACFVTHETRAAIAAGEIVRSEVRKANRGLVR